MKDSDFMQTIEQALLKLEKSKFRSSFKLKEKDRENVKNKGMDTVRSHARDFVRDRLAPSFIANDGKQTPMRGHPVFIAQHATACCCRGCLNKWYRIPKNVELTPVQQEKIVNLLNVSADAPDCKVHVFFAGASESYLYTWNVVVVSDVPNNS